MYFSLSYDQGYRIPGSALVCIGRMKYRSFQQTKGEVNLRYWEFQCGCGNVVWISTSEINRKPHMKGCHQCRGTGLTLMGRVHKGINSGNPDSCWLWQGALNKHGYGIIGGVVNGKRTSILVHRLILEEKIKRAIKEGYGSLHTCNNPPCCNPRHLYEGTSLDNAKDMVDAGHSFKGEKHRSAKLTDNDVRQIRALLAQGKYGIIKQLANQFGIGTTAILSIKQNKTWRHVL